MATAASADLEFGRFRVLLRRRQLLADGVPVEIGGRTLDVLLVLVEADGALVTKEELITRVWPNVVVPEDNLKFQVHALRKALGADRELILTEFGRGYRFTEVLRTNIVLEPEPATRSKRRSGRIFFLHQLSAFAPMQRQFDLVHLPVRVSRSQPNEEIAA